MADESKKSPAAGETASGEEAKERLHAARERFDEVVSDAGKRAKGLKRSAELASKQLRERAEKASSVARERMEDARESVRHGYDKVSKDLDQLGQDVTDYVRHNPGKSVAIALGVGFVLGLLLHPRRD